MSRPRIPNTIEHEPTEHQADTGPLVPGEETYKAVLDAVEKAGDVYGQVASGRAFRVMAKLGAVGEAKSWNALKEDKRYVGLPFTDEQGEHGVIRTWDECCHYLIGKSRSVVDEAVQNLNVFGGDFLESAAQLGLRDHHIRKLRKLPEDEQQVVLGEVETSVGDKDAILALIDDLSSKHYKERETLEKRADKAEKADAAKQQILDAKNKKIDTLAGQLKQRELTPESWPPIVEELNLETSIAGGKAMQELDRLFALRESITQAQCDDSNISDPGNEMYAEQMAVHYLHAVRQVYAQASELMIESEQLFTYYEESFNTRELNARLVEKAAEEQHGDDGETLQ